MDKDLLDQFGFQVVERTWDDIPLVTMQYTVDVGGRKMRSGASCSYLIGAEAYPGSRETCIEKLKKNAREVLQALVECGYSSGEDSMKTKTFGWCHRVDLYADEGGIGR